MDEEQKKPTDNTLNSSEQDVQAPASSSAISDNPKSSSNLLKVETNPDSENELSSSPKKQKKNEEIISLTSKPELTDQTQSTANQSQNFTYRHYQDTSFNVKGAQDIGYCSFSTTSEKQSEQIKSDPSNPIQHILKQASTDLNSEEDDQQKKLAAAKKLLFPTSLATSFSEVVDTLRNERRQEFSPIYKDPTAEEILLRQAKQKPVGSLLSKRIHWDVLKRKREEEERKAQMQFHYGPYGPVYANQQQQSFANPYEQYYATMQNQYTQMVQMTRAQQEHSAFWPEPQQQTQLQNNDRIAQNSMQQQSQPYTYPFPTMYSNNMTGMNTNIPSSYTSADYNLYLNSITQPPPPPPDEPYPY